MLMRSRIWVVPKDLESEWTETKDVLQSLAVSTRALYKK